MKKLKFLFKKSPLYRLRIVELNNGSRKYFPEFKASGLFTGYVQIVLIQGIAAEVIDKDEYFCNTIDEAYGLIEKHKLKLANLRANETKFVTIVPYAREEMQRKQRELNLA